MLDYQGISFYCNSSTDSKLMTRSSTYRFFPVTSCTKLLGEGIQNRDEQYGRYSKSLSELPFSHWTLHSLFQPSTLIMAFSYMLSLYEDHQPPVNFKLEKSPPRLRTPSNASSRSTKSKHSDLSTTWNFACSWHTLVMATVMPRPGMMPNCMSSILTCWRRKFSATGVHQLVMFSCVKSWLKGCYCPCVFDMCSLGPQ